MKRQRGGANNVNSNVVGVAVGVGVSSSMNAHNKVEEMAVVAGAPAMGKKRSKKEVEQNNNNKVVVGNNNKSVVVEEEMRNNKESKEVVIGGGVMQIAGDHHHQQSVMGWNWEEYMPLTWLGGVNDIEQMSWGTTWFPSWDMDFMGEAFSALYSDVVWDDDIWNLRKEIPIPLDNNRFHWG